MNVLESRLSKMNLETLSMEVIDGAHAGNIYKVEALSENENTREHYIYKEFAEGRDQEVEIHKNIEEIMTSFSRVVNVWDTSPKAMLMCDLGYPVKAVFEALSVAEKKILISDILNVLATIHGMDTTQDELPVHQLNAEWKDWCLDQLGKLCSRKSWASPRWERTIQEAFERLDIPHYQSKCPSVITHGDPHLENVF
ncbi:hypothetical protein [Rossellomorea vietnamensis]|uniref:hypothetical protein n=1 Tax=Rossellomorea vietnamensis TaxID=218284 RepID=UPI00077C5FDA|nr:hypothetical protein [Rossellomorea vietnamensis]